MNNQTKKPRQSMFKIIDWAGNEIMQKKGKLWVDLSFKSFDDAEDYLAIKTGDDYETDRGEYYIVKT